MTEYVLDAVITLIGIVFVGGPIAAIIAWKKDKRDAPRDRVDTLQKALELAGEAATAAIEASVTAAAAHARASSAEADSSQARADVARVRSDLEAANHHSTTQDQAIHTMRAELDAVTARLQAWTSWGRRLHEEWNSLREHITPPPLPDELTD